MRRRQHIESVEDVLARERDGTKESGGILRAGYSATPTLMGCVKPMPMSSTGGGDSYDVIRGGRRQFRFVRR